MDAKEAYELSERSDLKIQTMKEFDIIVEKIKQSANNGFTNVVFIYNPFTDYTYLVDEFKKLGYKVDRNDHGIRIDWSEPK